MQIKYILLYYYHLLQYSFCKEEERFRTEVSKIKNASRGVMLWTVATSLPIILYFLFLSLSLFFYTYCYLSLYHFFLIVIVVVICFTTFTALSTIFIHFNMRCRLISPV
uniref:Uncharacterized protein n=1 Tax=Schizaphis graminum TaxID=13262 RepID=A0A2S2NAV4_SCHGA